VPNPARMLLRSLRANLPFLVTVLVVGVTFRSAIADWNDVPTGSMIPTILPGERILVNKLAYDLRVPLTRTRIASWADPARGDIVVCHSPADGTRLVKRVIGVPGDVIELAGGRLRVNGQEVAYAPIAPGEPGRDGAGAGASGLYTEALPGRPHVVRLERRPGAPRDFGPVRVPADRYLVMGDNRDCSADSRSFGFLARREIVGEALAVVASLDPERWYAPRWHRFLRTLR
jgi:signal peptidase I